MKEKLQTKFATRQYMISDTFELYYYLSLIHISEPTRP